MAKRRTNEEFLAELACRNSHYPDQIVPTTAYTKATDSIDVKCLVCGHVWTTTPQVLLRRHGYPKCAQCHPLSDFEFHARLVVKNQAYANGDFEVSSPYKSLKQKVECKCLREGCGWEWKAAASSLLSGTGCPKCARGCSTSRAQEYLFAALREALGDAAVLSRDKNTIGRELDIVVPAAHIAVEPGSLVWHHNIVEEANEKTALCVGAGMRLIGFTDNCKSAPRPDGLPDGWGWYGDDLFTEPGKRTLKRIATELIQLCDANFDFRSLDWDDIAHAAVKAAMPRGTELFLEELEKRNDDYAKGRFVVEGNYISDKDKVRCRCTVCGWMWSSGAGSLLAGTACPNYREHPDWVSPKRLSKEEALARIAAKNSKLNTTFRVVDILSNMKGRVVCECLRGHGEYETSMSALLHGGCGCPKCALKNRVASRRKTHEQFVEQLDRVNPHYDHGNGFELVGLYKRDNDHVKCRCLVDGYEWEPTAGSLVSKHPTGCPVCGHRRTAAARHAKAVARRAERGVKRAS